MSDPIDELIVAPKTGRAPRIIFWLVIGLVAAWLCARNGRSGGAWPGGYVVDFSFNNKAGSGWLTHRGPVATVKSGDTYALAAGKRAKVVYPDGRVMDVAGPLDISLNAVAPDGVDFLRSPLSVLIESTGAEGPTEAAGAIRILSPVGVTRFTNPVVSWRATEGVSYDVAIVDAQDSEMPPRILRGVRPPLRVAQMETPMRKTLPLDRMQQVVVRVSGDATHVVGVAKFLARADATDAELPTAPAALLLEAVEAMSRRPTRTGDAWSALVRLPPTWARCELAVRLRWRIAAELGLADELEKAREDARRLWRGW